MHITHQTHNKSSPGQTDSYHKLERLCLPSVLDGLTVLDIGCNEGFFCNISVEKGASKVIGIDFDEKFLERARSFYSSPKIEFIKSGWDVLPAGTFDIILWTSAMHYELDPLPVLKRINSSLSVGGLLVLECGVIDSNDKHMKYSLRHDNGHWFPTRPYLEYMLNEAGFEFTIASRPEFVGTDRVPRTVFHCKPFKTRVMLITGSARSYLTNSLKACATKTIDLDEFILSIAISEWVHSDLENFIKFTLTSKFDTSANIQIEAAGLSSDYVNLLLRGIANSDRLVIINGDLTDIQISLLKQSIISKGCELIIVNC